MIKNFDVEDTILNIQNNSDNARNNNNSNSYCTINYADKWLEAIDEIKKLYERLLQAEKEKMELMQKMSDKTK